MKKKWNLSLNYPRYPLLSGSLKQINQIQTFFLRASLKLGAERQYLSGGRRGPVYGLMSGRDWLFLCLAISISSCKDIVPYLFGYKTGFSPLQNDCK